MSTAANSKQVEGLGDGIALAHAALNEAGKVRHTGGHDGVADPQPGEIVGHDPHGLQSVKSSAHGLLPVTGLLP